jgi:hypothetical protein
MRFIRLKTILLLLHANISKKDDVFNVASCQLDIEYSAYECQLAAFILVVEAFLCKMYFGFTYSGNNVRCFTTVLTFLRPRW